jgi:Domain of unknown function (DUF892)
MAKEPKKLDELFHDTLKDIYFAEKKILATLPKMAKAAEPPPMAQPRTGGFVPTLDREAEEAVRSIQDAQVMLSPDRRSTRRGWVTVAVDFSGSYQCFPAQLPSLAS